MENKLQLNLTTCGSYTNVSECLVHMYILKTIVMDVNENKQKIMLL